MTSYKKINKLASMDGFTSTYKWHLELSRMMNYKQKFRHVNYIKSRISYHQRKY